MEAEERCPGRQAEIQSNAGWVGLFFFDFVCFLTKFFFLDRQLPLEVNLQSELVAKVLDDQAAVSWHLEKGHGKATHPHHAIDFLMIFGCLEHQIPNFGLEKRWKMDLC